MVRCAFSPKITLDDAIGSHARLKRASSEQVCDQCHSSRVFISLTGWHCKLGPNTEGADLRSPTLTADDFALMLNPEARCSGFEQHFALKDAIRIHDVAGVADMVMRVVQ
jgi:hypothetical protein